MVKKESFCSCNFGHFLGYVCKTGFLENPAPIGKDGGLGNHPRWSFVSSKVAEQGYL